MSIGRNAPCPCGSGRLYKRCCWKRDRSVVGAETLRAERERAAAADWEADVVPLPLTTGDRPASRTAAVMIVSTTRFVLAGEVIHDPPAEHDAIAELMAATILQVAADTRLPGQVTVRYAELVEPLARRLSPRGVGVHSGRLDALDPAALSLSGHLAGSDGAPGATVSMAPSWSAWGLGGERTAAIFSAAAAWYRAAPWREMENADLLTLTMPGGRSWTACVMGAGGEEFGLALYADRKDVEALLNGATRAGMTPFNAALVALTFERSGDLLAPMRKEIAAAGWEVASTESYPQLMVAQLPAGGVTAAIADELTLALRAITAFAGVLRSDPDAMAGGTNWTDPETGVAMVLDPRDNSMWSPLLALKPCLPGGPGAEPEAALRDPEDPATGVAMHREHTLLLDAFARAIQEGGFSAAVCRKHVTNAGLLLDYLEHAAGIPIRAMTEYDLRDFYFDWSIRKVIQSEGALRSLPASLEKFLGFAASRLRLSWPWAHPIIRNRSWRNSRLHLRLRDVRQAWRHEGSEDVSNDLASRVLLHGPMLDEVGEWGEMMGRVEARLERELARRWLLWRDDVIDRGITDGHEVRTQLLRRQHEWERTAHSRLGISPAEAIRRERTESGTVGRWDGGTD